MALYRPRTKLVEARQWTGENYGEFARWLGYALVEMANDCLLIENRSGRVNANLGDYIVHESDGFLRLRARSF